MMVIPQRSDTSEVRRNNLELVLRQLATSRTASRAEIAATSGLTRATVSRLVAELLELRLVRESGRAGNQLGRPGTRLEIDGRHVLAVGAEINVDAITAVVHDLSGKERARRRHAVDAVGLGPETSVRRLAELCGQAMSDAVDAERRAGVSVAGIGVAIPGVVDSSRGIVVDAPNLHWRDVPLGFMLRNALFGLDAPVVVDNDANFGALAEYWSGPYAGTGNLVYIIGEVGIGGGILVGGRLLLGDGGRAGEVGHMCVDPNGPVCGCGRRGCWEALIGLNAFLRPLGGTSDAHRPETRVKPVLKRAMQGERRVLDALDALGSWIGLGAANIVNVLGPEIVILGGYFTDVAEWVLPSIHRTLRERVMVVREPADRLVAFSTLSFRGAAVGAALHAVDRVLSNPMALGPPVPLPVLHPHVCTHR